MRMQQRMMGGAPQYRADRPYEPLLSAASLGEFVRAEHGREGVRRYVAALAPFVPRVFTERLAMQLQVETPPERPPEPAPAPPPPPRESAAPAMKPEQLMKLMQMMRGGEGGKPDPAALMGLLGKK